MITADHLLNRTVTVERVTTSEDGMAGQQVTWTEVGTQPARIAQPAAGGRGGEVVVAASVEQTLTHRVYLLAGADVIRGDRLTTDTGEHMRVQAVFEPSEPAYRRADCVAPQAAP